MEYFERIITHYMILALERAGVRVDGDTYGELSAAFDDLRESLAKIERDQKGANDGPRDRG